MGFVAANYSEAEGSLLALAYRALVMSEFIITMLQVYTTHTSVNMRISSAVYQPPIETSCGESSI